MQSVEWSPHLLTPRGIESPGEEKAAREPLLWLLFVHPHVSQALSFFFCSLFFATSETQLPLNPCLSRLLNNFSARVKQM